MEIQRSQCLKDTINIRGTEFLRLTLVQLSAAGDLFYVNTTGELLKFWHYRMPMPHDPSMISSLLLRNSL